MDALNIIKLICLFMTIFFTLVNIFRLIGKNSIPSINFWLQSIGIFGFIVIQLKLY